MLIYDDGAPYYDSERVRRGAPLFYAFTPLRYMLRGKDYAVRHASSLFMPPPRYRPRYYAALRERVYAAPPRHCCRAMLPPCLRAIYACYATAFDA